MLGDDALIQINTGTGTAVTLPAGTTAGNTLLIFATVGGGTFSTPAGFTRDAPSGAAAGGGTIWGKPAVDAETSWTLSLGVSGPVAWVAMELAGLDASARVDVAMSTGTASLTSGTTVATSTYDGVGYALHSAYNSTGGVAATLGSHTNGYTEIAEQSATDGTKACVISVSRKYLQQIGTQQVTATASGTTPTSTGSTIVVYTAAGAGRAADVRVCAGAEVGSTTGLTASGNGLLYVDSAANVTVDAAAARTGNFGFRIHATTAVAQIGFLWSGLLITSPTSMFVARLSYRFRSALPSGDLEVGLYGQFSLRYISATQKLGLKHSAGSEQISDATIAAGNWFSVDLRVDQTATTHVADWQVTYADGQAPVAQAQASATGQTAGLAASALPGWSTAVTGDVDVDDIVFSKTTGHYPLGDMRIYPLKVDPAGTPTISGTTTNFQTFTANGTGAAWNATTARGAIDDIPPVIGGSADGAMQITAAASDYMEFPCETVDLAAVGGWIRGVRVCVCGWAAAATANTIGLFAYDGATEYTLSAVADPGWDNAAELWACAMIKPISGRIEWTTAKLDNLAVRVGRSDDATPDVGIHAFVCEAVVRMAETGTIMGEVGSIETLAGKDPDSAATLSVTVNTPAETGATLRWTDNAVPGSQAVAASSTHTETFLDAVDSTVVTVVEVESDPEFTERE
jgi:hypothetical protein